MVKGNEKDSNSPSSVNKGRSKLGDNAIIKQDLTPNGVVSNSQLELLKLLQHQNHQKQKQQSGNVSDFGQNVTTSSSSSSSGGGLMRNLNFAVNDNHNASSVSHGEVIDAEVRSHPAYFAYYYSNVNKNPSLPPPLLSLDEWQIFQRFQEVGSGSISECRKKDFVEDGMNSQMYQMQRGIALQKAEDDLIEMRKIAARNLSRISSSDLSEGNALALASGMGERRKSFADMPQGGFIKSSTPPSRLSRPASYNSLTDVIHRASSTSELENKATSYDASHPGRGLKPPPGFPRKSNRGVPSDRDEDVVNSASHKNSAAEFGLSSLHEQKLQQDYYNLGVSNFMSFHDYINFVMENEVVSGTNLERQMNFPQRASSMVNLQSLANASEYSRLPDTTKRSSDQVNNFPKRSSSLVNLQSLANSSVPNNQGKKMSNAILEEERLRRRGIRDHYSTNEQHQNQYMEKPDDCVRSTETMQRNAISTSYSADDLHKLGRIYKEGFLSQQKKQKDQQQQPFLYKPGRMNRQYNGNPASGPVMYKGNHMARSPRSAAGKSGGHLQKEAVSRSSNAFKSKEVVSHVTRTLQGKNVEGKVASGSLQELKNNKNKSLELSDVLNDVAGYSKDQHGSRFLQQKLETANAEEKTNIFQLVIPLTRDLMTDVFGNYVIQKFFESGTESQKRELASQIIGHVLPLSFQMYGCRVIQKALEVIDVEQKTELVRELDGSVMKCVHDQNGNHVIQKSIECVPEDRIQFIVSSFFGQVVPLSTHPYGCRVIQRVLEHCNDPLTQSTVMDEILNSVCSLAQDQYGNYVIQHVLQHGKPNERSAIIAKLTGQIVTMSQQKFASNVVEKCLTFAAPEERKVIVNEMLGSTDDNEVLQAMMKDPFGNYVVQKVLETCDDQDRELILARIRVHLDTLKKYTYAKHIVTRVEKLIEAGERQTEMSKKTAS